MKKERNISFKNYIVLGLVLIITIIFVIYFYRWYNTYEQSKLNTMILDEYLQLINYNELDNYLVENKNAVIYVSKLENQEIRTFEKKFKNIVNKYSLNNSILYLDLTNELKKDKYINEIKEKYNIYNKDLELPVIIIFKNEKVSSIYEIKDNNYNINELITYLRNEGIIND